MKKILTTVLVVSVVACTQAPQAPQAVTTEAQATQNAQGETYTLTQANLKWIGSKVTGRHEGIIPVSKGYFKVQGLNLAGGEFILNVSGLEVRDLEGDEKQELENHLKSEDFFAADSFPEGRFEITKVESVSGIPECPSCNARITGNLTLRGITKSISFPATLNLTPEKISAQANFNINRLDWNIRYQGRKDDLIRPEVNIDLNLEAVPEKSS